MLSLPVVADGRYGSMLRLKSVDPKVRLRILTNRTTRLRHRSLRAKESLRLPSSEPGKFCACIAVRGQTLLRRCWSCGYPDPLLHSPRWQPTSPIVGLLMENFGGPQMQRSQSRGGSFSIASTDSTCPLRAGLRFFLKLGTVIMVNVQFDSAENEPSKICKNLEIKN